MIVWYAVYEEGSGILRSITTTLPEKWPSGLTTSTYAEKPDLGAMMWNRDTRSFIQRPRIEENRVGMLINELERQVPVNASFKTIVADAIKLVFKDIL